MELAHWVAGPAAGGVLADWGADVVKVEPSGGDPMRTIWGSLGGDPDAPNGAFVCNNRGKRSVVLDVAAADGREMFERLLDGADVLVTNLRPGALERLALAPAEVARRHPRLVYCSVTAYGWGGPDQEQAGYDLAAFFGRSGISDQLTTQGTPPAAVMQGVGDNFTAMAAVAGILAALLERERTGRGRLVEASLLRTGMWALSGSLGAAAMGGRPRPPYPRDQYPTPMFNSYRTGDDRWFFLVGVEARRHLPAVLAAIGRTDLVDDERFATARGIVKHRRELIPVLDKAFAEHPLAHWKRVFAEHDVWWAPVQTPDEVVTDRQARATGAWVQVEMGGDATVESVESPIRFDGVSRTVVAGPPGLGDHTDEILGPLD